MQLTRRDCLKFTGAAAVAPPCPAPSPAAPAGRPFIRDAEQRCSNCGPVQGTVIIESVEMLRHGSNYFVRTRARVRNRPHRTKQVEDFLPLFEHLVAPHVIGRDARDLEALVDDLYRRTTSSRAFPSGAASPTSSKACSICSPKSPGCPSGAPGRGAPPEIPVYLSGSDAHPFRGGGSRRLRARRGGDRRPGGEVSRSAAG